MATNATVPSRRPVMVAPLSSVLPEWVRRAREGRLPARAMDEPHPDPVAAYRRAHMAHPMAPGLDPAFDALWPEAPMR